MPDFESALFAMLGTAAAPGQATTSNTDSAAPKSIANKSTAFDAPVQETTPQRPDEKKPAPGQDSVPTTIIVPLPLPAAQQVQVDSAAAGAAPSSPPASQPLGSPDLAIAQIAPAPAASAPSSTSLPDPADPVVAADRPIVPQALRQPAASARFHARYADGSEMASAQIAPARAASAPPSASLLDSADPAVAAVQPTVPRLPQLDDAKSNEAAQTPVARTESDKFVELLEAEVAQPADPESRIPRKNDPEVCADAPAAPPLSNQVTASPVVQSGFTQSQASDQTVQPVASNPRVMPRTSLSKPAFDQAAGVKSGHNPPLGKIQPPVVSPSSADRHSGKESASRMAGPAEQKPDAPSSDAVKAIDQSEAADTPPAKAQPGPDAAGALPPHALRADVMAGTDASDSSPKPDASSQAPADSRVATHAALPAERPAEPLRSAQLVEKITQSELRLEMRTGEFGNVEIRTSYDHQQVKAEISSQRGELGRTLSAELPGLEQRMRDQDVPLSAVVVHDASSGAGGTLDRDPRQQQQPLPAPPSAMGTSSANSTATVLQPEAWEPEGILDVRI